MISNPKPQPKSIFQILNPKSNLAIKFISSSAVQILSNYLLATKFDLQTTNLTKFFYHNLRVLGAEGGPDFQPGGCGHEADRRKYGARAG